MNSAYEYECPVCHNPVDLNPDKTKARSHRKGKGGAKWCEEGRDLPLEKLLPIQRAA